MDDTAAVPRTTTVVGTAASASFTQIRSLLDDFRRADRTMLVAEADEAGSSLRARHTRLEDWMTRTGQETPREASGAVALDALPAGLDRGQRVQAEQLILKEAEHAPAEKLRTMTENILRVVAPDQVDTPEQRAAKLEARDLRARHRRKLWFGPEADGSIDFGGSLPVVAGRRLQGMVQAVTDRRYRSAKDTRDRLALQVTPQQRAADALVEIPVNSPAYLDTSVRPRSAEPVWVTRLGVWLARGAARGLPDRWFLLAHDEARPGCPERASPIRVLVLLAQ